MQQAMASVMAGSRLACSLLCNSRPSSHSFAQPSTVVDCRRVGQQQCWLTRRSRKAVVVAANDWSSSNAGGPSRGVVTDEIEGIPVGEYGERYLVPNHMDDDSDDGFGEVRVDCDASGRCVIEMQESRSLGGEHIGGGYLRCDLTGCYFTPEAPAAKRFEVIEGEGWRLGYETAPESQSSFCAVVGAGGWSIALTGGEFTDFCSLIQIIRKGIITMDEDEITKEEIVLQAEKGSLWMECTIPKRRLGSLQLLWQPGVPRNLVDTQLNQAFEVRFILSGGASKRQAEGYWPADAVMDMLKKIDSSFGQPDAAFVDNIPRHPAGKV